MNCYAKPYEGDKPYIFFSYCHADKAIVYPIIERLSMEGFRIWYDDGLHPGDDWPQVIAEHIHRADICIAAISEDSSKSHSCKNEVSFVVTENKTLLSVILEDFTMPMGMRLQISGSNFIRFFDFADPELFYEKLLSTSCCELCREKGVKPAEKELKEWSERSNNSAKKNPVKPAIDVFIDSPPQLIPDTTPEEPDDGQQQKQEPAKNKKSIKIRPKPAKEKKPEKEISPNEKDRHISPENTESAEIQGVKENAESFGGYGPVDEDSTGFYDDPGEETIVEDFGDRTIIKKTSLVQENEIDPDGTVIIKKKPAIAFVIRALTGEIFKITDIETTIGRSSRHSQIAIFDESCVISKHHADIFLHEKKFYLRDNKSGNGTFLRDKQLQPLESLPLEDIDIFSLANDAFIFVSINKKDVIDKANKIGKLCILIAEDTQEWKVLTGEGLPLDRSHQWKDGVLSDLHIHRHNEAELIYAEGSYHLHNINSANGTFVNNEEMSHGDKIALKDGNTISIADTRFIYKEIPIRIQESK